MRRPFSPLGSASLSLVFALAVVVVPACGGGDDDVSIVDGGGGSSADAGGGGAGGGVLGQRCDGTTACPDNMPICIRRGEDATEGFCTKGCASTPAADGGAPSLPPQETHATCRQDYTGEATPACAAPLAEMNGIIPWVCILACGPTADDDFGTCPGNLACDQPDPSVNGFCFPPG
jgi:hypothetical protein